MANSILITFLSLISIGAVAFCVIYSLSIRKKYIDFTEYVCQDLDALISGRKLSDSKIMYDKETLASKLNLKMKQLSDVIEHHEKINLEQKQQIQSMVSDISHQLKTPIANMLMYNDTILNNDLPREKELKCLKVIHSQVEKMDFLTQSLVNMSRLENNVITLNKIDINVSEIINEAVEGIITGAEKKNISVNIVNDDSIIINSDPRWTVEAIFNILDNGVKYSNEGGNINVDVLPLELYIRIDITDDGIGIDEENINKIFKRFYREGRIHKVEGIGLGLFIAREIVDQHGGYIKVSSKVNCGSTFSIYLPFTNLN